MAASGGGGDRHVGGGVRSGGGGGWGGSGGRGRLGAASGAGGVSPRSRAELITLKGTLGYDGKAQELKMIRDYYNERYFEKDFVDSLSVWQMQYMEAMWKAEIEKRMLPATIKDIKKNLTLVKSALHEIKFEQMQKQEDKRSDKTKKRQQAAIAEVMGTPKGKRSRR